MSRCLVVAISLWMGCACVASTTPDAAVSDVGPVDATPADAPPDSMDTALRDVLYLDGSVRDAILDDAVDSQFAADGPRGADANQNEASTRDSGTHPDWQQIAQECRTIRDVEMISESEFYLACGDQGVLHVTDHAQQLWNRTSERVTALASDSGVVRALACNDIYRVDGEGWILEAHVGTLNSCSMGFSAGGGGWFVGTRSFGGRGGFWQKSAGPWAPGVDIVRGFEDFIVFSPTDFVANTVGVSTGLNHEQYRGRSWVTVSDFSLDIRSMWRIPNVAGFYFIAGSSLGGGTPGGVYRWYGGSPDRHVQEFYSVRLHAIWGRSATEVYVVGDQGRVMRSGGDGQWASISTNVAIDAEFVWGWHGGLLLASPTEIAELSP